MTVDENILQFLRAQTRRHVAVERLLKKAKKPKATPHRILRRERREHAIQRTMDRMKHWRSSPFELEGAMIAGLRSAFCLAGYSWDRSDNEAVTIVSDALCRMGAVRPSHEEGQREYVIPRENCAWCARPIPDDIPLGGRQSSYCCDICAKAAIEHRRFDTNGKISRAYTDAREIIQRTQNDPRHCEKCDKLFRPIFASGRFCSIECYSADHAPRHPRPCKACGTMFRPRTADEAKGHFCSLGCKNAHGFTTQYERTCAWCFKPFIGKVPSAQGCCQSCASTYSSVKAGKRIPKRISPPVFDYFFKQAA